MNERKYVDPKADLTFKKVFGEHPDLITSLLNALLPLPEDGRIASVEYLTPELVPDDPPELAANPEVRKALEMVEVSALTPEERARYDGFQDWLCRETRRSSAERRAELVPGLEAKLDAATACAEAAGCNWFLTTDGGILKKIRTLGTLKIANPIDFIMETRI